MRPHQGRPSFVLAIFAATVARWLEVGPDLPCDPRSRQVYSSSDGGQHQFCQH